VSEDEEQHFAALGPVVFGAEGRAVVAFDHAEGGLDLPTLAIAFLVEVGAHLASVWAARQLGGRPAQFGGDDCLDMVTLACVTMIAFAVVTGIGQHTVHANLLGGGLEYFAELVDIHAGAACGDNRKDRMVTAIAGDRQFGPPPTVPDFADFELFRASLRNEVTADVTRLQAGGIDGGQGDVAVGFKRFKGAIEQSLSRAETQQSLGRFVECRKMRYGLESKNLAQIRPVVQYFDNAPIVCLEEHAQHETDEQLGLGVLLGAETMAVFGQRLASNVVGGRRHSLGRFAGRAHARTMSTSRTRKPDPRRNHEISTAFLQSIPDPFSSPCRGISPST